VTENATPLTLLEVLRRSTEFLKQRGCDAPRLEAELLLSKGLGIARLDLYLQFDRPLQSQELAACRELVKRRGAREPMAYILGEREFRSLLFEVGPDVFIPRPDTEALADAAIEWAGARGGDLSICDIGTGSGCLAVSIAHALPSARVVATDLSDRALAVAARNAARHGVADRIQFIPSKFADAVDRDLRFDVIVSNPPYVLSTEIPALQAELRHEPSLALSPPGDDIRDVFRQLFSTARARLEPGGSIFVEIGEGQAELAESEATALGLAVGPRRRDLTGADRVVCGCRT
jgi:release factor glutamine methyltransferase